MQIFRRILGLIALILLILFLSHCAVPGSGLTRFSVDGYVEIDSFGYHTTEIELILPEQYGLSGLDAKVGNPSDYGHFRQDTVINTDTNGYFHHLFYPITYSAVFWIIPPLGFRPKYGPPPFFGLKFDKYSPFVYVIAFPRKQFDYKVYDIRTNKYLNSNQTNELITLTGELLKHRFLEDEDNWLEGWKVNLYISTNYFSKVDTLNITTED